MCKSIVTVVDSGFLQWQKERYRDFLTHGSIEWDGRVPFKFYLYIHTYIYI